MQVWLPQPLLVIWREEKGSSTGAAAHTLRPLLTPSQNVFFKHIYFAVNVFSLFYVFFEKKRKGFIYPIFHKTKLSTLVYFYLSLR